MSFAPVIDTSARHRAKSSKLPLRRGQSMSNVIGISGSQDTRGSSDAILHLASLILAVIFSDLAAETATGFHKTSAGSNSERLGQSGAEKC